MVLAAVLSLVMTDTLAPINLWPTGNPNGWTRTDAEITEFDEKSNFKIVKNVSKPTLQVFKSAAAKANAPTVLVCPGGGYWIEAIEHEGTEIAEFLNKNGVHAAVLKYRLPNRDQDKTLHLAPMQDAHRAIRLLRSQAKTLGFNSEKIGIMGFSAGGHLAAISSNSAPTYAKVDSADDLSSRPNFTVLVYTAYLVNDGEQALKDEIAVTKSTPPTFLVHTMDDPIPVQSALSYIAACKAKEVPVEFHLFPKGGHGYGLRSQERGLKNWGNLLVDWLSSL